MNRRTFVAGTAAAAAVAGSARAHPAQATPNASPAILNPDFQVMFIRHAESQVNVLDQLDIPLDQLPPDSGVSYPLTQLGVEQAIALADTLVDLDILAISSSTRLRCMQTSDALAFSHVIPIELAPAMVEAAFTAPDAGMGTLDYPAVLTTMTAWAIGDLDAHTPGGESLTEILARFLPFVTATIDAYAAEAGTLVFVSHGATLGYGLPYLFPNVSPDWAALNGLANTGIVTGAFVDGALVCTGWQGMQPE